MSFFKFKLDNPPPPRAPNPIAPSNTNTPSPAVTPDSHLKRSASSPHLSTGPLFDKALARQAAQLQDGGGGGGGGGGVVDGPAAASAPPPGAQPDDKPSVLNDGRARKRPAAEAPPPAATTTTTASAAAALPPAPSPAATAAAAAAVDALFRPWSKKTAGARKSTSCVECKASKTRCEKVASAPAGGDACSRCVRLSKQCVFDVKPAGQGPGAAKAAARSSLASRPQTTTTTTAAAAASKGARRETREGRESWEVWEPREGLEPRERRKERRRQSTPPAVRRIQDQLWSAFFPGLANQPLTSRPLPSIENKQLDIAIDSLISRDLAQRVFHHYMNAFVPKCPVVVFAPGTTHEYLRETRPLLFLSILSVASGGYCPGAQQQELALQLKRALAERAFVKGEQSLELLQALQIAALWYRQPYGVKQISLSQMVHIIITMAGDLGLDQLDGGQTGVGGDGWEAWDRAEARRAWLACFLLSTSISLILRRASVMVWSAAMDAPLRDLQEAQVAPTDAFFCELVRTEHLCHTVDRQLFLSNCQGWASVGDAATVRITQDLQLRVSNWRSCCNLNQLQQALVDFGIFSSSLYAHEPVMHVECNVNEFEAPFTSKSLRTCHFISDQFDTPQLLMLRGIVTASHGMLNCFLGLPLVDMLTVSPHIYGGRVIYSLVLLCKLHRAITTSPRDVTKFLVVDDLHLEEYLDRLILVAQDLLARDEASALSRSFYIVERLRKWYHRNRHGSLSASAAPPNASGVNRDPRRGFDEDAQRLHRKPTARGDDALQRGRGGPGSKGAAQKTHLPPGDYYLYPPPEGGSGYNWFVDDRFELELLN